MVTTGYAVVLCGWLIYLAVQVIRQRRKHQVLFADGGVDALVRARSAQSNATEYIPIFLILLGLAEMNGVNVWWIHALGGTDGVKPMGIAL
ncbi:glutathione S-transferase [Vibrio cholerae]|nr:glutathione S-transferase [Vibrio cholerae]